MSAGQMAPGEEVVAGHEATNASTSTVQVPGEDNQVQSSVNMDVLTSTSGGVYSASNVVLVSSYMMPTHNVPLEGAALRAWIRLRNPRLWHP